MLTGAGIIALWTYQSGGRTPTHELGVAFLAALAVTWRLRMRGPLPVAVPARPPEPSPSLSGQR